MESTLEIPQKGRTGYVALLGRPNTGKSTLLNTLLGCHLAAVSAKPQTTRRAMLGIYNDADAQVVFLDSPGVHPGHIALDEAMDETVAKVVEDADIVLCLADPTRAPGEEDAMVAKIVAGCGKPVVLALNKCDVSTEAQRAATLSFFRASLPSCDPVLLTATDATSARALMERLKALLPMGVFLYDREEITTAYERDVAADLIRETLLERLQDEIPHCIAVSVDSWRDDGALLQVEATLNLEREAHKGIVIGQGGRMIKALRRQAARKISELCQHPKVDLKLFVKVVPNWRRRRQFLKDMKLCE